MRSVLGRVMVLAGAAAGAGVLAAAMLAGAAPATAAAAQPGALYAAVAAAGSGNCADAADACLLSTALSNVAAGGTIELVTPGGATAGSRYAGNWTVSTPGTSASAPVTIEAAPGLSGQPVLDGDGPGAPAGETCSTGSCDGPVLTVPAGEFVVVSGLTIADGNNRDVNGGGGALDNDGTIAVSGCTFTGNTAISDGGAIDNGDSASGSLTVTGSAFSGNNAGFDGGAIDNGDAGGTGSVTVTGSTFSGNHAQQNGGALDSGDFGGTGSATVSGSTFSGNSSGINGAAIDSGDDGGTGSATVTDSSFTGNSSSDDAGAIDSGDDHSAGSSLTVTDSTFSGNSALFDGGAIDNGDVGGDGSATVADSTFSGNHATHDGGAIDSGDIFGTGSLLVTASTFSGSTAGLDGQTIDSGDNAGSGSAAVAGDVFDGSCDQASGTWTDGGYNVGSDGSCLNAGTGDVNAGSGSALDLGSLAGNGGPTQTIAPQPGSPVIGIIPDPATVTLGSGTVQLCPATDQRGYGSTAGAQCDAGAVQTTGQPPGLSITATLSSRYPKTGYGWYRSPVTVTFHCKTDGAPLTHPCPKPVTLRRNGRGQSVTGTITVTYGGTATVTVSGINIDQTRPVITVHGVVSGRTYDAPGPRKITCTATDKLSGLAGPCTLAITRTPARVAWRATATSKAGVRGTATGHIGLIDFYVAGAPRRHGVFTVVAGHAYRVVAYVNASHAPRYVDAAPAGVRPHPVGQAMTRIGAGLWAIKVRIITQMTTKYKYWHAGVLVGKTLHLIALEVLKT
jgi:predicted outer membrane repeat protein